MECPDRAGGFCSSTNRIDACKHRGSEGQYVHLDETAFCRAHFQANASTSSTGPGPRIKMQLTFKLTFQPERLRSRELPFLGPTPSFVFFGQLRHEQFTILGSHFQSAQVATRIRMNDNEFRRRWDPRARQTYCREIVRHLGSGPPVLADPFFASQPLGGVVRNNEMD